MTHSLSFPVLEASIDRLQGRMPELPTTSVLLSRILLQVGRDMAAMLEQQIRPFGLTEAEFRALTALFSQPDGVANPTELCAHTAQSPANMSRISDALVSRGLITRVLSQHDRRKMVLQMTAEGESLVRRLLPQLYEPLREMFKEFSVDEQRQLIGRLKYLCNALERVALHPSGERAE